MAFTSYDPDAPKQFAQYAELCISAAKETLKADLRYDLESIKKLDELVSAIGKPKNLGQMVMVVGAFLGEAFRHMYNGQWEWNDPYKSWAVKFRMANGKEDAVLVFAKAQKRFVNGMQDSIAFFAHVTDGRIKGTIP